jgi:cytochrome c-type biogenesis protein CcmH/NrfF
MAFGAGRSRSPEVCSRAMSPETPERILQDLSNDLMSPYCPGRTISSCPSGKARKLEDHILDQARAGKTREEIEADLVDRFGPEIVGYAPRPVVLYGTAIVALMALMLIAMVGRRWVRRSRVASAGAGSTQPADTGPSVAERDALEDALDEEDGF